MSITPKEIASASWGAFKKRYPSGEPACSPDLWEIIWCQAVEWAQSKVMASPGFFELPVGVKFGPAWNGNIQKRTPADVVLDAPGYAELADVLARAFQQSSSGKGKERHAGPNNPPFVQQPIMRIAERRGVGFLLGQADKKSEEALGLPPGRDVAEILGAIVYLAAAVIFIEKNRQQANDNGPSFDQFKING